MATRFSTRAAVLRSALSATDIAIGLAIQLIAPAEPGRFSRTALERAAVFVSGADISVGFASTDRVTIPHPRTEARIKA
jgi:hypothetical protein